MAKLRDEILWYKKLFPGFDHILHISDDEYICCVKGIDDFSKVVHELGLEDKEIKWTLSGKDQVKYFLEKG